MSDYKKMVCEEAKSFFGDHFPTFESDAEEHGGKSTKPNLSKWLDRTRHLVERLDEVSKDWSRAEIESIKQSSRNSVSYGGSRESAYFAYYKDLLHELKKLQKSRR